MITNSSNLNSSISTQKSETIKVCIRIRPLLSHEDIEYWEINKEENSISSTQIDEKEDKTNTFLKPNPLNSLLIESIYTSQNFHFDKIYTKEISTQTIYIEMCREITKNFLKGINGSIFTYGQTTSGKTYTMLGNPKNPGILPCVLKDIFDNLNKLKKENLNINYKVYCSYIEIYNENIHDLLTDASSLKLIDDNKYGIIVGDSKKEEIKNFEDGIKMKNIGEENRKYRDTMINEYSSRSHTIFQLFLEISSIDETNIITTKNSILNLVDLAGSEKLSQGKNPNGETGYINKSLFVLANVINKLAEGKNNYIPYRDSKLTRLLSVALGGNSLITIICNVSPSASNYFQTLSTFRFASRAKVVKLKPNVNEYFDEKELINLYKNHILKLRKDLKSNSNLNNNIINVENSNINNCSLDVKDNEDYEYSINEDDDKDYKMRYFNEVLKNKKLKMENEKLKKEYDKIRFFNLNSYNEDNKNFNSKENNFIEPYIKSILSMANNIKNTSNIELIQKNLDQINQEYLNQLNTLQHFYFSKIKDIQNQIINLTEYNNDNIKNNYYQNNFQNNYNIPLNFNKLFEDIPLQFINVSDIQNTKLTYEEREEQLEELMDNYTNEIEKYYNTLFEKCKLNGNQNDLNKISMEYQSNINKLNEIYETKQSILENNFFATLKILTSKKDKIY